MKYRFLAWFGMVLGLAAGAAAAGESPAELLEAPGVDLSRDADRAAIVARMKEIHAVKREQARAKAVAKGLPVRRELPGGRVMEIADFNGEEPVYFTTHNVNAAISTGANLLRVAPYSLFGSGMTVGIWDGGSVRATHQEFGTRVTVKDGSATIDHATHVGGTIAATGVVANARGMANLANIDSYDWNNDVAEMTAVGATGPGQEANRIYLSNHSYGYVSGWVYQGGAGNPARTWEWYGNGTTTAGLDQDFGRYDTNARGSDSLAYNAPYYLIFRSAGNDRGDNPATGAAVALSPGSSTVVAYDPALHPAGDSLYRGGFDTISYDALAKNVMTVGSVSDAVAGGVRSVGNANISSFSSWGPTDDGRIKPDVVANGEGLYSSVGGSDSSYASYSGTSMATPNACGSSALLVEQYRTLFPGQAMRASTLKGLLIHTADDRGNAGPDYKYGWGLVNVKAAADLLIDHQTNPAKQRLVENQLTTATTSRTVSFVWDGVSPISATLCWTDPAGASTTTSDSRTARLVNNLDLKIVGPGGSQYLPYVMPFVGTWTQASMDLAATTGVNNTDNVEQVRVPGAVAGVYQVVVSYSGALTNNQQNYSLVITGGSSEPPPPPPPVLSGVSPSSGLENSTVTLTLSGTDLTADTAVKLTAAGHADIPGTGVQLSGSNLTCQVSLPTGSGGLWNVVATRGSDVSTLVNAFTVVSAIWSQNFDGPVTGWTSSASTGSNSWSLVSNLFQSPSQSYFAPGPATKTTASLMSPVVPIPAGATNLQLKFWHYYNLQNARDGGKLELSVDGGSTWFDVAATGSGASFSSNGYNTTIVKGKGKPVTPSDFENLPAWSGNSGGFIETIVNLNDTAKFAGKNFRARWKIATDDGTASTGWYVDSILLVGGGDLSNHAPVISSVDSSSTETLLVGDITYEVVRTAAVGLSAVATDDSGEPSLSYTWSVLNGPGSPAAFSVNSSNAAKATDVEFSAPGDYVIGLTVRDAMGLSATGSLDIRVVQTATGLSVLPATASVTYGGTVQFSATLTDQFSSPMNPQPTSFSWTVSGGGTIQSNGLFTSNAAGGPYVVTASSGSISEIASVTVNRAPAGIVLSGLSATYDGSGKAVVVTTNPPNLARSVTYNGATALPVNAGSYAVAVSINDPNYQGSASGTLVIAKAAASVVLGGLHAAYDGSPKSVTVTTTPSGLATSVTYNGSPSAPSAVGSYNVVATVNEINYQGSSSGVLEISSNFDSWTSQRFTAEEIASGRAGVQEDFDGDGLENLAEYALGTDPKAFTPQPAPVVAGGNLTLTFTRPAGIADVAYAAEQSDALGLWSETPLVVIGSSGGTETLRASVPQSTGDPSRHFLRLRFTRP